MIYQFNKFNGVYFRITKTASSSLIIAFRKSEDIQEVPDYDSQKFKFTFVRNPFDRLASAYRFMQRGNMDIEGTDFFREMSFDEFLDVLKEIDPVNMDIHLQPQYMFIPEKPDFIGRYENLAEDFQKVCQMLGLPKTELTHTNSTGQTRYSDYFHSKNIQKVIDIYKDDFILFDYDMALPKD